MSRNQTCDALSKPWLGVRKSLPLTPALSPKERAGVRGNAARHSQTFEVLKETPMNEESFAPNS